MDSRSSREKYIAAAIAYGQAMDDGDSETANSKYDEVIEAFRDIEAAGKTQSALLDLLDHSSPHVRGWAATHLLSHQPRRASTVILEISKLGGIVGLDAKMVLCDIAHPMGQFSGLS